MPDLQLWYLADDEDFDTVKKRFNLSDEDDLFLFTTVNRDKWRFVNSEESCIVDAYLIDDDNGTDENF